MTGILQDLYVANRIAELTDKSELTPQQKQNPKLLAKALDKLYNNGKDQRKLGDEERAYIHFMKVLNMHSAIKASREYKKDKQYFDAMLNTKTILDSINQAEAISESLQHRYEERDAKIAAKNLNAKCDAAHADEQVDSGYDDAFQFFSGSQPASNSSLSIEKAIVTTEKELPLSLTAVQLYDLLKLGGESQPLLIDARSETECNESHINYSSLELVNIPEGLLSPGILPATLRSKLTPRNQSLFDARANYKRIVLLDWDSTVDDLSLTTNPLRIIKDAIYKWDQQTKLASEPQILEGGYQQWLTYYPQHTTNPQVPGMGLPRARSDLPDLDSISYDFEFEKPVPVEVEVQPVSKPTNIPQPAALPSFNRANKPVLPNSFSTLQAAGMTNPMAKGRILTTSQPPLPIGQPSTLLSASKNTPETNLHPSNAIAKPAVPTQHSAPTVGPQPAIDRNLKPQPVSRPVKSETSKDELTPLELHNKLQEQNRKMIAEATNRLEKFNAEKVKLAELSEQTKSESNSLAELLRRKKEVERELQSQEERLRQMKVVQEEHDSPVPQVNRNLKPNLEDWEWRLSQLQTEDFPPKPETHELLDLGKRSAADLTLKAEQQSKLIEEHNRLAKLRLDKQTEERRLAADNRIEEKKLAEQAGVTEEQRISAERARLVEEQRISAECARLAEEQRISAEREKLAEEQRLAAERAKFAEKQRIFAERARLEKEQRLAAEKDRRVKEQQQAEEQKKAAEEAKLAAQRKAAEEAKMAEQRKRHPESHKELPPGWQRKLDGKGIPYYINYQTGESTYASPAQPSQSIGTAPVPPTQPAVTSSHPPAQRLGSAQPPASRMGQGSPPANRSTVRLKSDETTFGIDGEISSTMQSKSKMKKFNSIPNLSQLNDSPTAEDTLSVAFNRSNKPVTAAEQPETIRSVAPPPFVRMDSRRLANLSPEYGSTSPGLTGLYNMGNTCYMNSALQCLSHTTLLCKYFKEEVFINDINRHSSKGTRGTISTEFSLLLQCLWTGSYRYIIPRDFKHVFGGEKSDFNHFKQMDSQEFLNTLLDTLHEDLNTQGHLKLPANPEIPSSVPEDEAARMATTQYKKSNCSIIISLFSGTQRSVVHCKSCHERSYKFDHFTFLPLEIRTSYSTSLNKCLDTYQRVDELDGYKCGKCKRKQCVRRLELYNLPAVLIIFFKRFNQYSTQFSKKTNMIDFPESLQVKGIGDQKQKDYKLYGVVNHYGSLDSGHYTAFCRNIVSNQWHKFNDENVSTVRSYSEIKSSAAYILFYSSVDRHN